MRAALIAVVLLAAVRVAAQDEASGESEQARLQRDQARVGQRLQALHDKLERLAQRYQDEGRTRNAELLHNALARFDEEKLLDVQHDVQRGLEQGSLSTVERQDALASGLESVYAVLRDRKDVEDLAHQADLARQGLAELGVLAENERRLLSGTRAASDTPADLLKQALKNAADLLAALTQAQQAATQGAGAEAQLGDAALAAQLAGQQHSLANDPSPTAATQALLQEALAALRAHLAQQPPPTDGATLAPESIAAAESARDRAKDAAADAAEAMQAAKDALEAAAHGQPAPAGKPAPSGTSGKPGTPGEQGTSGATTPPKSDASSGDRASQTAAGATPPTTPPTPSQQPAPSGQPSPSQPPTSGQPSPSGQPSTSGQPSPAGQTPPSGPSPPTGQPSPSDSGSTPPKSGTAAPPRDEPEAMTAARQKMEDAAARLDEVRDELDRSERSLAAARNRARAAAQAAAEQGQKGGKDLDDLAQRLEAAQPQSGPEMLDRTRQLLDELAKLQQAAQDGQLAQAGQQAGAAKLSIDQLIAMLKARQAGASDQPPKPATQADLDKLAQQQADLQHQTEELMKRLSELPDKDVQQPVGAAKQAMQGAQDALHRGDPHEGATREQEAAEQLDQAKQQMSGSSSHYEQLRQDEVLFRLNEDLAALLKQQHEASGETKDLDDARQGADRLSRSQRRSAGRLAETERDLSAQSESMRVALQQDEALAFEHALAQTRDDLSSAADKLADEQTGWNVQMLQSDVEQRLGDLLAVLQAERDRRAEALKHPDPQDKQQGQGGSPGKEPLVPTVAELLLIQRMEQAALSRLDAFTKSTAGRPAGEGPSDAERDMLQRWAGEHQSITTLFREKFQQMADPHAGVHVTPDKKPDQPPDVPPDGGHP